MESSSLKAPLLFDRSLLRVRQAKAWASQDGNFLHQHAFQELWERLQFLQGPFASILVLGPMTEDFFQAVAQQSDPPAQIVHALEGAMPSPQHLNLSRTVCDLERLPFEEASFDLVFSNLCLHWANDFPGVLWQVRRLLKPDGVFLGSLFGGRTLQELRHAFLKVESQSSRGVSPRVSPFVDLQTLAHLLQRATFALPVAHQEVLNVTYPSPHALMKELQAMGESNALVARAKHCGHRETLKQMAACYEALFKTEDGRIPATFEILYLLGRAPSEKQQRPQQRGTATHAFSEVL